MLNEAGALTFDIGLCAETIKQDIPPKDRKAFKSFAKIWYKRLDMHYKLTLEQDDAALFLLNSWQLLKSYDGCKDKVSTHEAATTDINTKEVRFVEVVDIATTEKNNLVESLLEAFKHNSWEMQKYFYISLPVLRDSKGGYLGIDSDNSDANNEVYGVFMLQSQPDACSIRQLTAKLKSVIEEVHLAHHDQEKMHAALATVQANWSSLDYADKSKQKIVKEAAAFIAWIANNFEFTGLRIYTLNNTDTLKLIASKCAGIFALERYKAALNRPFMQPNHNVHGDEDLLTKLIYVTKANIKSAITRDDYLDLIGLRILDEEEQVIQEIRFVGLLGVSGKLMDSTKVPLVRLKVENIYKTAKDISHYHRVSLLRILSHLPIEELIQAKLEDLYQTTVRMLIHQGTNKICTFIREDFFKSFYTVMVVLPTTYSTGSTKRAVRKYLANYFSCSDMHMSTSYPMANFVMLYFTLQNNNKKEFIINHTELNQKVQWCILPWEVKFKAQLVSQLGEQAGLQHYQSFANMLTDNYKTSVNYIDAVIDIDNLSYLKTSNNMRAFIEEKLQDNSNSSLLLRLYTLNHEITVTTLFPILKNMGLNIISERKYDFCNDTKRYNIVALTLEKHNKQLKLKANRASAMLDCLTSVLAGTYQDDRLNALILEADIDKERLIIIRAYVDYMLQIAPDIQKSFMFNTILKYPALTCELINMFKARFDPINTSSNASLLQQHDEFLEKLEAVQTSNEDTFFRLLLECLFATMRTNYFVPARECLVLKLYPRLISAMPSPKPKIETFIHAKRVTGTHLRMSNVSRGGIRWSSRKEDYRKEVLGLMQAQQLKNSVISPDGGKGVFIASEMASKDINYQEGLACYKIFIRGLLSITDNIVDNKAQTPEHILALDSEDTYMVVAADKGTATFSDYANQIAYERNFWLGDAFASGGKNGYDHKKLGITAKGAWQSLHWHMLSLGVDVYQEKFTMVAIGDMSGDVFGNGLLVNDNIMLVAAFDHRHIFIDPNPKPKSSLLERKRLFKLSTSTWDDYDKTKLSLGGGVYTRSAKYIHLSSQAQDLLGINYEKIQPDKLIALILSAKVDVLFNAGIGTYVKSSVESHEDVGDSANDSCRVNADQLQARAVVEGGNLGFTKKARIDYDLAGGRINLDSIDNAGGVICSDYEVNIKILLQILLTTGEINYTDRNKLLAKYVSEVEEIIFEVITLMNISITLALTQAEVKIPVYVRYIESLSKNNVTSKEVDDLPSEKTLKARLVEGKCLTRPEAAILLSHTKIELVKSLLTSGLIEDSYCERFLLRCFPESLYTAYSQQLKQHPLKNKIIATRLSGYCIRVMGITYIKQMADEIQAPPETAVKAVLIIHEIFSLDHVIKQLDSISGTLKTQQDLILQAYQDIRGLLRNTAQWLICNKPLVLKMPIQVAVQCYKNNIHSLLENSDQFLSTSTCEAIDKAKKSYLDIQIPEKDANIIAKLPHIKQLLILVDTWQKTQPCTLIDYAKLNSDFQTRIKVAWLQDTIDGCGVDSLWTQIAKVDILNKLDNLTHEFAHIVCTKAAQIASDTSEKKSAVDVVLDRHIGAEKSWLAMLEHMYVLTKIDFSVYTVAIKRLELFKQALTDA